MTRLLLLTALLVGCTGNGDATDACALAEEHAGCPECADGVVSCTYEEHEHTAMSCGGCQALSGLYRDLCDAGVTDSQAAIEAGTECVDVDTGG